MILEKKHKIDWLPVLLLSPTILIIGIVMIIPLIYGLVMSFFNYDIGKHLSVKDFIGLKNYIKLINDPVAWKSLKNTIVFVILGVGGDLIIGTLFSVLLLRVKGVLSKILRALCTMPLLISPIVIGLIWRYMYDPYSGIIYWLLGLFGMGLEQFPGITEQSTALLCVVIAHWWQITPFVLIVVTAGLVAIPQELYEAATIDGAGGFRSFWHISLPLIKNIYMVILITSGVGTVMVFDIIYSLTQGGPVNSTLSVSIYAYKNAFELTQMGYAMSIAIMLVIVAFLIFGIPFIKYNSSVGKNEVRLK